jgi:uncharacterized protein YihD (DUF1040 family)
MRDPNRIDKVLNTIKFFWKKNPDLRLAQMILNLAGDNEDIFFMEEDELLERLNALYSDSPPRNQPFQDYGED